MALLGAQRIVLGIINRYGVFPFYLSVCLFLGCILLGKGSRMARWVGRLAILLLLLRLSTPVLCFVGTQLNQQYFDPRIEEQATQLSRIQEIAWAEFEIEHPELSTSAKVVPAYSILPDFFRQIGTKVSAYAEWMKQRAVALRDALVYFKENFSDIMDCLTGLFVLVLEKIILLAILLPLGLLYALRKIYKWITEEELDHWIDQAMPGSRHEKKKTV
ncbi:MAG: hypothetical protein EBY43_06810 [Opitutae bacterium]|nr:hypothetical protein [Opitutae bacterium]